MKIAEVDRPLAEAASWPSKYDAARVALADAFMHQRAVRFEVDSLAAQKRVVAALKASLWLRRLGGDKVADPNSLRLRVQRIDDTAFIAWVEPVGLKA